MSDDPRQAARNAWVDQQMASAAGCRRSMRDTIRLGIASGTATAISTLMLSVVRWLLHLLLITGFL